MVFFFLNLSVFLIKKEVPKILVNLSFSAGFTSSLGIFMIGVFPGDGSQDLHTIAATFFFLGGLAYCILYGISELKGKGISKFQALSGFVVAFFFVVFIFFNTINYFNPELALELSHLSEWILFTLLMFWIFEHEISMKRDKKLP
jgi:hypothetical protein